MRNTSFGVGALLAIATTVAGIAWHQATPIAQEARFVGPTSSQPLALSANGALLAVVNPDNDSVTFFNAGGGTVTNLGEIPVGDEPNGVALSPDGSRAFVANTVSGTVSVLSVNASGTPVATLLQQIPVGTEPYGLALTPNGTKLYVSNSRSNTVSVINTSTYEVIKTIDNVGFEPRGIAITMTGTVMTPTKKSTSRSSFRSSSLAKSTDRTMRRPVT